MFLFYLDESFEDDYALMVAIMLNEPDLLAIEQYLAVEVIDKLVPEGLRRDFEFHASKMFHSADEFKSLNRDEALRIFENCARMVGNAWMPITYGAVDTRQLRRSVYSSAPPLDVAFRACLEGLETLFATTAEEPSTQPLRMGMLICDDTKNQGHKKNMQESYRARRRKFRGTTQGPRTTFEHWLLDDMYFGDSAYSVGIQLADICAFIILRHLKGCEDTEYLYKIIERQIVFKRVVPEDETVVKAKP